MASPAAIPITVIGGYLGAGKTTLLNRLLGQSSDRRIGVVVNDFGELGIDATLLRSAIEGAGGEPPPIVNLANGCVCCTLGDDLRATLETLAQLEPRLDHIVIEASGVADPATAAAWGTVPGFVPGGIVVLAAADTVVRSARDRYVGAEVLRQLAGADLLVVSKADLCTRSELSSVLEWLRTQSGAPCIVASRGQIDADFVLGPSAVTGERSSGAVSAPSHDLEPYATWSTVTDVIAVGRLDEFLRRLPEGLLRMKGFVDVELPTGEVVHRLVQVVGRTVSVVDVDAPGAPALEAIGVAGVLDVAALAALAADYLRGQ